jgi:predicted metalloendopeptidase
MADNVGYTPGTGAIVAADEIDGVLYQRIKPTVGANGIAIDVSEENPMPVQEARVEDLLAIIQRLVKVCESLQVVDSAQRQRVTIDAITGNLTLATVSTVSTVSSVTNVAAQTSLAGMDREMYINIARQTYENSIRSKLTF